MFLSLFRRPSTNSQGAKTQKNRGEKDWIDFRPFFELHDDAVRPERGQSRRVSIDVGKLRRALRIFRAVSWDDSVGDQNLHRGRLVEAQDQTAFGLLELVR